MNTLERLARMVETGDQTPMDVRASSWLYAGVVMVHRCCKVNYGADGRLLSVMIVARGKYDSGPFVFIYPSDGVDPDQPAFLGMATDGISFCSSV